MKAIKIDAETRTISEVYVDGLKDLQAAVGGYIESALRIGKDRLFVNEEGLINGTKDFFKISQTIGHNRVFAGNGIIVGDEDLESEEESNVHLSVGMVENLITFLDYNTLALMIQAGANV